MCCQIRGQKTVEELAEIYDAFAQGRVKLIGPWRYLGPGMWERTIEHERPD